MIKIRAALILSISSRNNSIKLWNVNTWEYLCYLRKANKKGELYSAYFLNGYNKIFIVTCNDYFPESNKPIKISNFELKIFKK